MPINSATDSITRVSRCCRKVRILSRSNLSNSANNVILPVNEFDCSASIVGNRGLILEGVGFPRPENNVTSSDNFLSLFLSILYTHIGTINRTSLWLLTQCVPENSSFFYLFNYLNKIIKKTVSLKVKPFFFVDTEAISDAADFECRSEYRCPKFADSDDLWQLITASSAVTLPILVHVSVFITLWWLSVTCILCYTGKLHE